MGNIQDEEDVKIGGENVRVQIDETAICNGKIITDPSNTLDYSESNKIQWLVGGVEEGSPRNFFITLVENRNANTIYNILKKYVDPRSVVVTDGHASYPPATSRYGVSHQVVNHSLEFVTFEGVHTNSIENLWSHLKMEYKMRTGIARSRMIIFLNEFRWRKRNCNNQDPKSLVACFLKAVNLLK